MLATGGRAVTRVRAAPALWSQDPVYRNLIQTATFGSGSVGLCSTVPTPNKEAFAELQTVKDSRESYVKKKSFCFCQSRKSVLLMAKLSSLLFSVQHTHDLYSCSFPTFFYIS